MQYVAITTTEGRRTLAEFPDCPGCQTFAGPGQDIRARAQEALEGWIETGLQERDAIPRPRSKARAPRGGRVLWVTIAAQLAVKLGLRWARQDSGLTQAELARRAGVSQQQIAKLEDPDSNPTIETLEKVARALGRRLEVALEGSAR